MDASAAPSRHTLRIEERRQMFACELLQLLGHRQQLDAALNALGHERPQPGS